MYLLDTSSLKLVEFQGSKIPPYAILSHRWEAEEVSFQALLDGSGRSLWGWPKIECCCDLAASQGFNYVWIDTCCIDKRSSQEVSEAINSMFRWYKNSEVCYVYLEGDLATSTWFTRGWTLQELIAPRKLVFYISHENTWLELSPRGEFFDVIAEATGIEPEDFKIYHLRSIARLMSWAAKRETTKPEEMAYSLLGLFDVNMPLLYGEGAMKAFLRLQNEILRVSDDESIFAWSSAAPRSGLLALSPAAFADAGQVTRQFMYSRCPYLMTNKGLNIKFDGRDARYLPTGVPRRDRDSTGTPELHTVSRTAGPQARAVQIFPRQILQARATREPRCVEHQGVPGGEGGPCRCFCSAVRGRSGLR